MCDDDAPKARAFSRRGRSLLALFATLAPLEEEFPVVDDPLPEPFDFGDSDEASEPGEVST